MPARLTKLSVCLVLCSLACQSTERAAMPHDVAIWHVVIIKLNDPGDPVARQKLIDASKSFRQIPGVRVVYVGKVVPGLRPHQDSSFDVAVALGFKTTEALAAYASHPIHVKAVNDVLKPLAKDYTLYDFTNE